MPQVTIQASRSAYLPYAYPNTNDHSSATITPADSRDRFLIGFAAAPDAVKFKKIDDLTLYLHGIGDATEPYRQSFAAQSLREPFDEESVTYNTTPKYYPSSTWLPSASPSTARQWYSAAMSDLAFVANLYYDWYRYGLIILDIVSIDTAYSNDKPYMIVTYLEDDATADIRGAAPASGYVPKAAASVFSWQVIQSGVSLEEVKAVSTTFRWRAGSSGTIHAIACGTAQSVTVPAGTFTADEIQWSVAATLNTGATITSDWCTLSTVEALSTAETVSPAGIVIDGTAVNRFSWQHIISTGTAQTKAELQQSADGSTWSALATVTGADTYWDAPADTFTAGTKYWRVRTYNTDNAAGSWSDAAEFIAINAPSTPSISIRTTGPRPTIAWQTSEQQAYEVALSSGYRSGTQYGTGKTWTSPVYLDDGSYTVRVRVQNQYGLWSDWGEAALPVVNTPGEAITLTVMASQEAVLIWQTAGSYDFFVVERDGVAIARVTGSRYTDLTSIGTVRYRVRGCYAGSGNYGISDTQSVDVRPEWNMICELAAGEWLDLRLSETQTRANGRTHTAQITTVHLLGLAYPVAEAAEFRDLTLSVSCAFPRSDEESAKALEALVGRLVCLKTPEGSMATGYLAELQSEADEFMRRYAFSITNIHRQEAITLDA